VQEFTPGLQHSAVWTVCVCGVCARVCVSMCMCLHMCTYAWVRGEGEMHE